MRVFEIDSKITKLKRQAAPASAIITLCLRRRFLVSQARKKKAEAIDKVAGEGGGNAVAPPTTHIITTDGEILTGQAAADKLAEYFASVHAEIHIAPGAPTIERDLPQLWSPPPPDWQLPPLSGPPPTLSMEELMAALAQINPKSSCGADGINFKVLRTAVENFRDATLKLFNRVYANSRTPQAWSVADWLAIPKSSAPNVRNVITNQRGISIGGAYGKLFEATVAAKIKATSLLNSSLSPFQGGFMEGRSTIDNYIMLNESLSLRKAKRLSTRVYLIDVEKAFDTVHILLLCYKLCKRKVNIYIVHIINCLLTNMQRSAKFGDFRSALRAILSGVAQGSITGPLLYIIFIDDILDFFEARGHRIEIPYARIILIGLLFADDITLIADYADNQSLLSDLALYAQSWRFVLSFSKSIGVDFLHSSHNNLTPPVSILQLNPLPAHSPLQIKPAAKYLGIFIGTDHIKLQVKQAIARASAARAGMLQLSLRGHSISPVYLIRVALPKITPHLEYGSQYWASKLTQTQASKLCSFKDTTVRHLLRLHARYTASFPINYSPASNVVLYMDICYPPTTYKHHYLVIKKFSSIKTDSHLGTLLAASIKHPTKLSWASGLRKVLKIYDMDIETVMTPIPKLRHMMRPYWWSFLRAYINTRPYLAHLVSELPATENYKETRLPWEAGIRQAAYTRLWVKNAPAVRSAIAVRSGCLLPACGLCKYPKPPLSHSLWTCPLLTQTLKGPISPSLVAINASGATAVDAMMRVLLDSRSPASTPVLTMTMHYIHKVYKMHVRTLNH